MPAAPPILADPRRPGTLGAGAGGAMPTLFQQQHAGQVGGLPPAPGGPPLPTGGGGASLGWAPPQPSLAMPSYGAFQAPGVPNVQPTNPGQFTGKAPTPTAYGDFQAPTAANFEHSPDYAYLQAEQAKASQRGAASRGTLLTGGFQKALQRDAAGIAAGDFQHAYDRALTGYTTNRDTNAQNFGQRLNEFGGNLNAFQANTAATLGYNPQAQSAAFGGYDRSYGAARDTFNDQRDLAREQTGVQNANAAIAANNAADDYARTVDGYRAQNAALTASYRLPTAAPMAGTLGGSRKGRR